MTIEEIKNYLRIDDDFDNNILAELIDVSQLYIDSCVGEGYKSTENGLKLAKLLQKKIINDMYENRSSEVLEKTKQDRITTTILDKLSNFEVVE